MKKLLPALFIFLLALASCRKEQQSAPNPPAKKDTITTQPTPPAMPATATITKLLPYSGTAGTTVIISGTKFGTNVTSISVLFNGVAATINSVTDTAIQVTVPVTATGNVTLKKGSETILGPVFTYTNTATLTGISPSSGAAGTIVTLKGTNFGTSIAGVSVSFNGLPAGIQFFTDTEIRAVAPVSTSGPITLIIGNQTITGTAFTYVSPFIAPYVSGNVILTTQAEVDAFVAQNKGRQLQITGNLNISGADITSVSGLFNITSVSGLISINSCPLLNDVSFLNNITAADNLSFQNLPVTVIIMDKLVNATSYITVSSCKNLNTLSLKALTSVTGKSVLGSIRIISCEQLSHLDFSSLSSNEGGIFIAGTAISDLSGFSSLQKAGALTLSSNPSLINLHGLEQLTTLTLPAISGLLGGVVINGIYINSNVKLTSLTGLQNLKAAPIARITSNIMLNDFCPAKALITTLSTLPAYSYRSTAALTLTNNGSYPTTKDALAAVALCN
ncbi:MAG: hypothetical protein EOP41_03260 [Sphingobacteriaceae bacterium]|nr:MAG: hypothetical protein EOP41_03260 [Sphingobacteriaceae bacterium]